MYIFIKVKFRTRLRSQYRNKGRKKDYTKIFNSIDLLHHSETLWESNWRKLLLAQLLNSLSIVAQIKLGADENDRSVGTVMRDLGVPLGAHVLERRRRDDREADEEDVGLGVGERTQAIVVLLTGRIPQTQVHWLAVYHHVCREVVEYRWDVLARERVCCVRDEQAGFAYCTVAYYYALDRLHYLSISLFLSLSFSFSSLIILKWFLF